MTIIAAVDNTDDAERVVKEAAYLARNLNEELQVVHVKDYSEIKESADSDAAPTKRSVREQAQDVAARIGSASDVEFEPIGLIGRPSARIVSYAASTDPTYVVIGGRKRSPVGKAMFGSDTQKILLNAPCPVLTVLVSD
jgi:nucleotide-binding universal stress UspA family protein